VSILEKTVLVKTRKWNSLVFYAYSLIVLCLLFFASCPNPFDLSHPHNQESSQAGTGYFSLYITGTSQRTVLPQMPAVGDFAAFDLAFSGTMNVTVHRTPANLSDPINLLSGGYELVVTAYMDFARTMPAAYGSTGSFTVNEGVTVSRSVILSAYAPDGSGTGTYSWDIEYPATVTVASMKITPLNAVTGSPEQVIPASGLLSDTGSVALNTGYYEVLFTFEMPNTKKLEWLEILHVYRNLTSNYDKTFGIEYFNNNVYTVTLNYNYAKPVEMASILHGDASTLAVPTDVTRDGYEFEGWWTKDGTGGDWGVEWKSANFDALNNVVYQDFTLYAKWVLNIQDGTPAYPFLVWDETDLRAVGRGGTGIYATGDYVNWTLAKHYRQMENIDLTGSSNWTPIGTSVAFFTGSYDGGGKTITALKAYGSGNLGLFYQTAAGSKVSNLGLVDVDISGISINVGGIVGFGGGTVENCHVSGSITSTAQYTGGIFGGASVAFIKNCHVSANVGSVSISCNNTGGIVGSVPGGVEIEGCSVSGNVTGKGNVGGILGIASNTNNVKISDSYVSGNVTGSSSSVGGILGKDNLNPNVLIEKCYTTGNITGTSNIGGIIGNNIGTVKNCYVTGNVSGTNNVGGIAGSNDNSPGIGTINNSVVLNAVITQTSGSGALFGRVTGINAGTLADNYSRSDMIILGATRTSSNPASVDGADLTTANVADAQFIMDNAFEIDAPNLSDYVQAYSVTVHDGSATTNYADLAAALGSINAAGTYTVTLFTSQILATNMTLDASGSAAVITLTSTVATRAIMRGTSGDLLTVNSGVSLILQNIIIDGNKSVYPANNGTLVMVNGALTMKSGAVLQNNYNGTTTPAGTVNVKGTFTMEDGEIRGNNGYNGSGVFINGSSTFIMTGGAICNNTSGSGGGVFIEASSVITLGGTARIYGNTAGGKNSNLFLSDSQYAVIDTPATGMEIWVTKTGDSGIITGAVSAAYAAYFFPDSLAESLIHNGVALQLVEAGSTADMPFLVRNETELRAVGRGGTGIYATGEYVNWTLDKHYKQMANIDLTGNSDWERIGTGSGASFTGSYDGNGHTIIGLTMPGLSTTGQGMFGYIGADGVVKNLGLVDISISSSSVYIGGIAGQSSGYIENCFVTGSITSTSTTTQAFIGGIIGFMSGAVAVVNNCYVAVTITSDGGNVGGIVGLNGGSVTNCMALNQSITRNSGTEIAYGRVSSGNIGATYTYINNYAWDGMVINIQSLSSLSNQGSSLTATAIKTQSAWITALFSFGTNETSPWQWAAGKLPGLYNHVAINWPDYLVDPVFSGNGSISSPFEIHNEADLRRVGTGRYDWTVSSRYIQMTDIDLTGKSNWIVIGSSSMGKNFTGGYDGNFHTITGLTISSTSNDQGMFGYSTGGTVKNLGLINANISGGSSTGGIVGNSNGTAVQQCYVSGSITGTSNVGGIVGRSGASGKVQNCYATANVTGTENAGGIVGQQIATGSSTVNCYSTGDVFMSTASGNVGGIVASTSTTVTDCVAINPRLRSGDSSATVGRINGAVSTSMSGNYALAGMMVLHSVLTDGSGGTNKTPLSVGDTAMDGADATVTQLNTESWWDTNMNWDWTNVWGWNAATKLPILSGFAAGVQNPQISSFIPGTVSNPFLVTNETDLRAVGKGGTSGYTTGEYVDWTLTAHYKQMADIDLTGKLDWTRIGTGGVSLFTGNYNGNGYTIAGLTMTVLSTAGQGMFGFIGAGGVVRNLGLVNVNISGSSGSFGCIAGQNNGIIENCFVTGSITSTSTSATAYIGGITGYNGAAASIINNCFAAVTITSAGGNVGGIAGNNTGSVTNCIALNRSINQNTSYTTHGRIAGSNAGAGVLIDNYAWSGMQMSVPVMSDKDGEHGADLSAKEIRTKAAWTAAGFLFTDSTPTAGPWVWDSIGTNMPSLGGAALPWPLYLNLTSISNIQSYLASHSGGTTSNPIYLDVDLTGGLGDMTLSTDNWQKLLQAIQNAGKYVALDLSACTMNGTIFDPDRNISTGKGYIVSLVLPDEATRIPNGAVTISTFNHFDKLESVSGANVITIGDSAFYKCTSLIEANFPLAKYIDTYAFSDCSSLTIASFPEATSIGNSAFRFTSLTEVSFPAVTSIGEDAFYFCNSLTKADFPLAESIGNYVFDCCSSLAEVNFPAVTSIGDMVFGGTGTNALTIILGDTAPTLGEDFFLLVTAKMINVKVPVGATGYSPANDPFDGIPATFSGTDIITENWANALRGMGWDGTNYLSGTVNSGITVNIVEYLP